MLTLGLTGGGAGSCNSVVNDLSVARGGDLLQSGKGNAADVTLRTSLMTGLGAGGGLFRNFNRSMSSCVDCFGLGCRADRAGVGLDTGVLTGRRGRDLALVPLVSLGGNLSLCNDDLFADGAVLAFGLAGLGAGRLNCRINDLGMALGGDGLAVCDLFVTILAVGIAGVAGLGASGFLGITELRILVCAAPNAIDIVDGVASLGGRGFRIGTVGVVQLGGGDGDLNVLARILVELIGLILVPGAPT